MSKFISHALLGAMALALSACGSKQPADTTASLADTGATTPAAAPAAPPSNTGTAAAPAEFAICAACHSTEAGKTLVGPSLAGVVGRKAGTAPGFAYSDALKGLGTSWDEASLDTWLTSPMAMAPGTKMTFAGMPDAAKRKIVIDYLKTLK